MRLREDFSLPQSENSENIRKVESWFQVVSGIPTDMLEPCYSLAVANHHIEFPKAPFSVGEVCASWVKLQEEQHKIAKATEEREQSSLQHHYVECPNCFNAGIEVVLQEYTEVFGDVAKKLTRTAARPCSNPSCYLGKRYEKSIGKAGVQTPYEGNRNERDDRNGRQDNRNDERHGDPERSNSGQQHHSYDNYNSDDDINF